MRVDTVPKQRIDLDGTQKSVVPHSRVQMLKKVLSRLDQRARTIPGMIIKQDSDCTGLKA